MRGYESSTALAIYIQNIIKGLKELPDDVKPHVYLFYTASAPVEDVRSIAYPYIEFVLVDFNPPYVQLNIFQRLVNRVFLTIGKTPVCKSQKERIAQKIEVDVLYPNWLTDHQLKVGKAIHWIIDFQYIHLPHFFSEEELSIFFQRVKELAYSNETVVVSSHDAKKDFTSLHADYTCDVKVLNFVSGFDYHAVALDTSVLNTYDVSLPYFITPNQFWPHKNHITVLKALKILVDQGYKVQVVFTGTPTSYRDSSYAEQLVNYVESNQLNAYVRFLGFLPRTDMLNLVRQSKAIVQPSLFEGWSTLVEESKALSKFIILSDLSVHREQIKQNCLFFNPAQEQQLADAMKSVLDQDPIIQPVDYSLHVKQFALTLADLFELKAIH